MCGGGRRGRRRFDGREAIRNPLLRKPADAECRSGLDERYNAFWVRPAKRTTLVRHKLLVANPGITADERGA